jgi:hypothetical protein
MQPFSILHVCEQQSPPVVLPSSHCSGASRLPLPHRGGGSGGRELPCEAERLEPEELVTDAVLPLLPAEPLAFEPDEPALEALLPFDPEEPECEALLPFDPEELVTDAVLPLLPAEPLALVPVPPCGQMFKHVLRSENTCSSAGHPPMYCPLNPLTGEQ